MLIYFQGQLTFMINITTSATRLKLEINLLINQAFTYRLYILYTIYSTHVAGGYH